MVGDRRFVLALVLTPLLLWLESRTHDPLLDLTLFADRLYTMGNLTGLLNGVARYAVLFLLVFYLQGVKGEDPVTAGIILAPWRSGLVFSPISGALSVMGLSAAGHGRHARRRTWSRRSGVHPDRYAALAALHLAGNRRRRSGDLQLPEHVAVTGVVPPIKRGIGAGMRACSRTRASSSASLGSGTADQLDEPKVLIAIATGVQSGSAGIDTQPFIPALHVASRPGS